MSLGSKFNPLSGINYWDEKHYSFEVSIPSDNYTFTLRVATSDKAYTMDATNIYINPITVDWGDGITEEYSSGDMTHTYTTQGDYKITILSTTGNMPYFTCSPTGIIKRILTPLLTCYTGNNPRRTFDEFLRYESNCRSLPKRFFVKNPQITSMNSTFQFYGWYGQWFMPSDLFYYTPNVTDMGFLFSYSRFKVLPNGIFDKCTEVTTFNSALNTFYGINNISSNIFDKCTKVTDFSNCFGRVSSTVTLPRLWERTNVTNYSYCFNNASSALNYYEVPYSWGGPSRVTFNVTPSDANIECKPSAYHQILKIDGTTYIGSLNSTTFTYKISKEGYAPQEGTVEAGDNTLDIVLEERNITVTIRTSIEGIKVLLTAYGETVEGNSIKVGKGATVAWETVSDYYGSKSGTITNVQEDTTEEVQYTDRVTLYSNNLTGVSNSDIRYELNKAFNLPTGTAFRSSVYSGSANSTVINERYISESSDVANADPTSCVIINPIDYDNLKMQIGITCKCNKATDWVAGFHFGKSDYPLTADLVKNDISAMNGQFLARYITTSQKERIYDSKVISVELEKNTTYYLNMINTRTGDLGWIDNYDLNVGINYIDILVDKPTNWEQYKLGFNVNIPNATITLKYKDTKHIFTNGEIYDTILTGKNIVYFDKKIDKNTLVYYKVEKNGYYTVDGWTRVVSDNYIKTPLYPYIDIEYIYPFDNISSGDKEALGIEDGSYAINSTLNALVSQSSYHKARGTSYGYLSNQIYSRSINPQLVHVEIDAYVSSQNGGDYGCILIGNNVCQPTVTEMKNQTFPDETDGDWKYLMCQSGTNNSLHTYTTTYDLMSSIENRASIGEPVSSNYGNVVLSFGYAKNLFTNSGEDRLIITRIKIQTVEDSLN